MSVATSTAIAIGVGAASAAGSIASAKIQSNAAKGAAQTQQDAAQKSLDFQKQQYAQQQQNFAPYQQQGQAAATRLGGMAQQAVPQFNPNGPQPQPMGQLGMPPQGPPTSQPMAAQPGMPQQGGTAPTVKIRSSDGEVRDIPAQIAPQFLARPGFTRVG